MVMGGRSIEEFVKDIVRIEALFAFTVRLPLGWLPVHPQSL